MNADQLGACVMLAVAALALIASTGRHGVAALLPVLWLIVGLACLGLAVAVALGGDAIRSRL